MVAGLAGGDFQISLYWFGVLGCSSIMLFVVFLFHLGTRIAHILLKIGNPTKG